MTYNAIFARSFRSHDQKKFRCGAFAGCFIIAWTICTVFKPYFDPLPVLNLQLSLAVGLKMLTREETSNPQVLEIKTKEVKPVCNLDDPRSDVCEMTGDIHIHGNSSTVFVILTDNIINSPENNSWTIRPYARKEDEFALRTVKEFTVKLVASSQQIAHCNNSHNIPGVVFSTSGYSGNHFHAFTDIVIPLYLTSREFGGEVKFVITDKNSLWISKYQRVLQKLSNYDIIDIDREVGVHCFPSMILGLIKHREFNIDPSRYPYYSMKDFRMFLREAYSLKREKAIKLGDGEGRRPRLLIISRKRTRAFMNQGEIVDMAKTLGFKVVVTEADSNLSKFASAVNSCDVMMGVHGAGLTNILFLPENAIFIQIVPLGGLEWLAKADFGNPSKDMNLRYIDYKIGEEESSLRQQYPPDHQVFRNPNSISEQGWDAVKTIYLEKQNVKLDVGRFRPTLLQAMKLLHL
ncbi:alpha-1,3-arabinosyltransferase XAT3-like [Actinidia eriantha]|uniref:alpha-1,3-arabinosyltransferase XAT3-like n=1 Tax=Actinidia eriantha TaxID=165200 RepID=UPI00258454DB|nr:alpha-1,3-arabinosyltransferase XAT3-like [Actinidia eriantha]